MQWNRNCRVWFNDGLEKIFHGWWTDIILNIAEYCDRTGLETIKSEWF